MMSLWSNFSLAKEYQFIWNPYCPYACDADKENGREGVAIDIIKEVFKHTPHTVTFLRIDSWLRAKRLVASGVSDGMAFTFYCSGQEELGFVVPSKPMVISTGGAYLSLAKNKMSAFKTSDLARFKVIGSYRGGVNNNEAMANFIRQYPDNMAYFTGTNILDRISHMLTIGRLDIWLDSADLLHYFVSKNRNANFSVSETATGNRAYGGMLFRAGGAESKVLAKIIDDGISGLRKNGKLNQLLAVYGMKDNVELVE